MRATSPSRSSHLLPVALALSVCASACVEKSAHKRPVDPAQLAAIVKKTRPTPEHALDIRFEDKVRLLGYGVSAAQVTPDRPFTVTWHWQVDRPLGDGFQIFTHLADAQRRSRLNVDGTRLLRQIYPVPEWKAGDFIEDAQEITLPADWGSDAVLFYVGFYNASERVRVVKGPKDDERRAEALRLPVTRATEERPLPRIFASHAEAAPALDGRLDEPVWTRAQSTGPFVDTMNGRAGSFPARAQVAYDAEHLYVAFVVDDDYLITEFTKPDDHLWERDTVEVMLDPDGDSKNYFEIQVSPRGVHFDTRYDSPRQPRPFGDVAWSSMVKAGVALRGALDDDEADRGYTVELALPWKALSAGATPAAPPALGSVWRMNLFVVDSRPHGQRAVGWSPPLAGDFHTLQRFGRVVFTQPPLAPRK